MYDYGYLETSELNIRDSVKGVVTAQNYNGGLHINLSLVSEEGENKTVPAFGYWTGLVAKGTEVICTIKRFASDHKDILVRVDSVEYDAVA